MSLLPAAEPVTEFRWLGARRGHPDPGCVSSAPSAVLHEDPRHVLRLDASGCEQVVGVEAREEPNDVRGTLWRDVGAELIRHGGG